MLEAWDIRQAQTPEDAEVTERDKTLAQRFWAKYATPLLKRLLAARKAE